MNDRILRAARCQPVDRTPIWLMRQAGRYMSVYRAIRERHTFLEMVKIPEVAAEVTLQPAQAFDIDAAIIFADILPPLEGLGINLTFEKGEGPVIHNPVRTPADIAALKDCDPRETTAYTLEAIKIVQRELNGRIPLFGFSGAPFTLASYAIEGGSSREYRRTKLLMYRDPQSWHALMEKLTKLVSDYLIAQVEVGCQIVQIFDSWAGSLAPNDFAEYVMPHVKTAIATVRAACDVPIIYFGTEMHGMASLLPDVGSDVIGLDWRVPLDEGWAALGHKVAVQGNLDPMVLHAPWPEVERRAADILQRAGGRPGHIFNVGHGILTETPEENVGRLVDFVHNYVAEPVLAE